MAIHELAISDAQLTAGGFIFTWDDNGFGDTIYINIEGPTIPPDPIQFPSIFERFVQDYYYDNPLSDDIVYTSFGLGNELYITGFSMNDSYGGEPSI